MRIGRAPSTMSVLIFLLAAAPLATAGTVYDAAADFSLSSNPNGVWSYGASGSTLGSAVTLFTSSTTAWAGTPGISVWQGTEPAFNTLYPLVGKNTTNQTVTTGGGFVPLLAGQLFQHPAPSGAYSVVRFTAPSDGSYALNATFEGRDVRGTTTDVHVLVDNVSIFDGNVNGFGSSSDQAFSGGVMLHKGDTIDFAVGFGSNHTFFSDSTALAATISSAVPEPSSVVLFGFAVLGGLVFRMINGRRSSP
jgi:hypothetical protein